MEQKSATRAPAGNQNSVTFSYYWPSQRMDSLGLRAPAIDRPGAGPSRVKTA